ncbi:hypothetical protein N7462_007152 [Penicillium macrosclerotiorum]|uniref:uncharacterized protein n=1 Tax=Penicillium macrosclerotiorum TaxID=303699 RepID=UPI002546D60E|nr:uncharacterized protein N7462_007152 [Penicillium macrosclerotiorum]KAJ5678908.1 hypothetical protein N7462_007152 [Penicillium macrosclerotiorum]
MDHFLEPKSNHNSSGMVCRSSNTNINTSTTPLISSSEYTPKTDAEKAMKSKPQSRRRRSRTHQGTRPSRLVPTDTIDGLDHTSPYTFHHEGPFDAATRARNRFIKYSPLDAVKSSNAEALRATPADKIRDCLDSHRPLDGVAYYPPGSTDRAGQFYDYQEGPNMMDEHGRFRRLPGTRLTDEDFRNDAFSNGPPVPKFARTRESVSLRKSLFHKSSNGTTRNRAHTWS